MKTKMTNMIIALAVTCILGDFADAQDTSVQVYHVRIYQIEKTQDSKSEVTALDALLIINHLHTNDGQFAMMMMGSNLEMNSWMEAAQAGLSVLEINSWLEVWTKGTANAVPVDLELVLLNDVSGNVNAAPVDLELVLLNDVSGNVTTPAKAGMSGLEMNSWLEAAQAGIDSGANTVTPIRN